MSAIQPNPLIQPQTHTDQPPLEDFTPPQPQTQPVQDTIAPANTQNERPLPPDETPEEGGYFSCLANLPPCCLISTIFKGIGSCFSYLINTVLCCFGYRAEARPEFEKINAQTAANLGPLANGLEKWKDVWDNFRFPCAVTAVVKLARAAGGEPIHFEHQSQYARKEDFTLYVDAINLFAQDISANTIPLTVNDGLKIAILATHDVSEQECDYYCQLDDDITQGPKTREAVMNLVSEEHPFVGAYLSRDKLFYNPVVTEKPADETPAETDTETEV